jgi:succinyl-diaminopimelate desuccinylase
MPWSSTKRLSSTRGRGSAKLLHKQIAAILAGYRQEMLDFLRQLIAIPTENPPGRMYEECAAAIAGELERIGLRHEAVDTPPDARTAEGATRRRSLVSFFGTGKRVLYFHGHYDVVPRSREGQFTAACKGPNLFGRGSSDMKSGLVAMIYAVRALKEASVPLRGRIGLIIVPDEETGGAGGSAFLNRAGILGRDGIGMMTAEPTSGAIWNANRGAISLRVTLKGKPAHVGLQHLGVNAFEQMLRVAGELQELKREVEARTTQYRIRPAAATHSILMLGGKCEGGSNFNLVPGECSFTVDRRINPEENLAAEKKRLLNLLARLQKQGLDLDVDILQEGAATGVSEKSPLARALAANVIAVTGKAPSFEMCPGLLENRFYAEKQVPALAYGPGLLSVSHGPNEFVPVKNIFDCAAVYALTAAQVLSGPGAAEYPRPNSTPPWPGGSRWS